VHAWRRQLGEISYQDPSVHSADKILRTTRKIVADVMQVHFMCHGADIIILNTNAQAE